jgi:hypothetical protein
MMRAIFVPGDEILQISLMTADNFHLRIDTPACDDSVDGLCCVARKQRHLV